MTDDLSLWTRLMEIQYSDIGSHFHCPRPAGLGVVFEGGASGAFGGSDGAGCMVGCGMGPSSEGATVGVPAGVSAGDFESPPEAMTGEPVEEPGFMAPGIRQFFFNLAQWSSSSARGVNQT